MLRISSRHFQIIALEALGVAVEFLRRDVVYAAVVKLRGASDAVAEARMRLQVICFICFIEVWLYSTSLSKYTKQKRTA